MPRFYEFGPFRFDTEAEILLRGDEVVGIGRRGLAVLRELLERPGEPVTKDYLIGTAWSGLSVEEANLTVQIAALRRVLADNPGGHAWIETLPRRGYRYMGPRPTEVDGAVRAVGRIASAPPPPSPITQSASPSAALVTDTPSIAVLPFQNVTGDAEQDYFADGVVEEITTALARFRHLFVIGRNSSFTYKGRSVQAAQIGREMGVRYLLEGSVRKSGNRVRIVARLIDAATERHLWADRFDGALKDIFALQDQITQNVVGSITPTLQHAEIERALRKPTESLGAYDFYLRGLARFHPSTKASISEALQLFRHAAELDPNFAAAFGMVAWCYVRRKGNRWAVDAQHEISAATPFVRRALELGRDDAVALCSSAYALAYVVGEMEQGAALLDQAIIVNPNLSWAFTLCGWPLLWLGKLEDAIDRQAQAMRLSPRDPQSFLMEVATSMAHFCAGRDDQASAWAAKAFNNQPNFLMSIAALAASNAAAGRREAARKNVDLMLSLDPALRLSALSSWLPFRKPEHAAKWSEALRQAGVLD
jgi:TolB-like protein/Tfp pilus assembly protein PilF